MESKPVEKDKGVKARKALADNGNHEPDFDDQAKHVLETVGTRT